MSADILDDASEIENNERERLIAKARNGIKVQRTGRCAYCNDILDDPMKVYCGAECRDDHELEEAAMKRHRGRC